FLFSDAHKASNGELIFSDQTGYFAFFPDSIKGHSFKPNVFLSSFKISEVEVIPTPEGPLKTSLFRTELIHLSYNQNSFSFDFNTLHFSTPGEIHYSFKLDDYGNGWNHIGADHIAYFFKVPPGDYVFTVRAVDAEGNVGEKSVRVNISPPWW